MNSIDKQRSIQQNKALHKYCELLADALNDAGFGMKAVMSVKVVDVPWSMELIKQVLWKTIQEAMLDKASTTELTTTEISEVYKVLDFHISENFGVHVEWPSREGPLIGE